MTTLIKPHLNRPIRSYTDLVDYLARGARPREQWGIGVETEKLVVDSETGEAAHYSRIETLLQNLEASGSWQGVREEGHLIALLGEHSSITLEPGGQLELSGRLCRDIHCSSRDLDHHVTQIVEAGDPLGLTFLGLGVQPFTPLEEIAWVPKKRYDIMAPYMRRTGERGQEMMKQTAGLQVNVDFCDEADCIEKFRVALLLTPLLYALFANSPLQEGRFTGFLSTRGEIWRCTDPDRTGLLPQIFDPRAGFQTFVDYALDVPMYFIMRQGELINLTEEHFTFRQFFAEGYRDHSPLLEDWDIHLSTLFPEVRLRPQIEVRCSDSLPPRVVSGVAALIKGILYDREARETVRDLLGGWSPEVLAQIYQTSWREGLHTPTKGRTLREVALDVLQSAREGLVRQSRELDFRDESPYLEGVEEIARSGKTLAERLLERWDGDRRNKVRVLQDHCGYSRSLD